MGRLSLGGAVGDLLKKGPFCICNQHVLALGSTFKDFPAQNLPILQMKKLRPRQGKGIKAKLGVLTRLLGTKPHPGTEIGAE